jgi:hypothetical protein
MSTTPLEAAVPLAVMVAFGVWLVVWGRALLMRPEPTPRFAARWEQQFTKWGVLDANTPSDARSQLVLNWKRINGRQNVSLGVASLIAAGVALLGFAVLRDLMPVVSPSALFIPTFCPWSLALIICTGLNPPFDVAHGEQAQPSLDTHNPWRLLRIVPALCAALALAYMSLLALLGLGVLLPDPSWYRGEVTASSFFWVPWVPPILMLLAAGLSAYFLVQTARQRPIYVSGDPDVDQRAASKQRDYQLFRLGIAPAILTFLTAQAETFLIPLHSSDVTDGILTWLMFGGIAIALVGFVYAVSQFAPWTNGASAEGDAHPIPDSVN